MTQPTADYGAHFAASRGRAGRAPQRRRRPAALLAALIVVLGFAVPVVLATSAFADGTSIANIARAELGPNGSAGHGESPANSGCNKYTGALYGQSSRCAAGYGNNGHYGTWAWCADFATWVWRQAGADIGGLNSAVSSFRTYGNNHGTYHDVGSGYVPQPGDAALYGNAHIGIVVSSGKAWPDVVQGNWNYNLDGVSWAVALQPNSHDNGGGAALSGFVTPVGGTGGGGSSGGGGPSNGQILGSSCRDFHTGPSGSAPQIDCIPNGATIGVVCVKGGQAVSGPFGTETIWDRATYNGRLGFVSDAWVFTGTNSASAPDCGGNGVVMTPGCQTLYAAPTTSSQALACVPEAIALTVDCTASGDNVGGPFGAETLWDHTTYGGSGFVPDAEIYTGTANAIAGTCASIPTAPTTSSETLPRAVAGHAYATGLSAAGGTGGYSWTVQRGSVPPGLSLTSDGALSGTPSSAGTYSFGVQVVDSYGLASTATETVTVNRRLSIATTALPGGVLRKPYSAAVAVTGGMASHRTAVVSGALPAGVTLSSAGRLSGTPTRYGTFKFTVRASDSESPPDTTARTYTVKFAATAVRTSRLPAGTHGRSYRATLSAWGGIGTRSWRVTASSLPSGLKLSRGGVIHGRPKAARLFHFRVTVRDAAGHAASRTLTIRVR